MSRTTLAREHGGYDLDDERSQDAEDHAADERAGLSKPDSTLRAPDLEDDDEENLDEDLDEETAVATTGEAA